MNGNTGYGETEKSSASDSIKPGFMGGAGGGEMENGLNREAPGSGKDGAKNELAKAEKDAEKTGANEGIKNGVTGARENEEKAGGFYSGAGKKDDGSEKGKKGLFRGKLSKKGPIFGIIFAIFGAGGLMAGAQFFQPFSLVAQFQESFGSMQASSDLRSKVFFRMQMSSGRTKSPLKGTIFNKHFSLSKHQKTELAKQGIQYDDTTFKGDDGKSYKVLLFDDGTGEMRVVAPDAKTAEALNKMDLKKFETDGMKINAEAMAIDRLYSSNEDFFRGLNKGSMTWRGAISGWFGKTTAGFLKRNKITRNLFSKYIEEVERAEAGNTKEVARKMMDEQAGDEISEPGVKRKDAEQVEDEDGNKSWVAEDAREGGEKTNRSNIKSEADVKARLDKIAGRFGKGGNVANTACLALNFVGGVSLMVTAVQARQIITLAAAHFEAADKTKAGYGDESPINELGEVLNTPVEDEIVVLSRNDRAVNMTNDAENVDDSGIKTLKTETKTTKKTAMQSAGIGALYSNGSVDYNDPEVRALNFSSNIKHILGGLGTSMAAFEACSVAKITAGVVNVFVDGLEAAACIAGVLGVVLTFGASLTGCGGLIAGAVKGVAVGIGVGAVLSGIISTITPIVTNALQTNIINKMGGGLYGTALVDGGLKYLSDTHRANSGSLATRKQYISYKIKQQEVIAENARYERDELSPFDLTSKYTFMGSLLTQFMGFASTNSLMSIVTTSGKTISSSMLALGPTATAYDVSESLPTEEEYKEVCPELASIGAVGNFDCYGYAATDVSTMEYDPADVINVLIEWGDLEEGPTSNDDVQNVSIVKDSDLADYIIFCNNRESAFGIPDQNINDALVSNTEVNTGVSKIDALANSAIGSVPFVGDAVDIISNSESLAYSGYISGESCVAGNNLTTSGSPNWEKAKYYQRFGEDQTLAESMGIIDESAVSKFLNEYYALNPVDDSYEGMLARYSGLPKEDVIAYLDILDYYNYIAQYDPSERYAFGEPVVEESHEIMFDNENVLGGEIVLVGRAVYADVRNRSFAV